MDLVLLVSNLLLALIVAPLLNGLIKSLKAGWQSRRGPGMLQPWFDIVKYLGRESVESDRASWVFRWAPYVYFGSHVAAVALIPTVLVKPPLPGVGDVIVIVGLLALGRFALALAGLDTASSFGGMGTSREMAFGALVEPALFIALFALAIPAGSTSLSELIGDGGVTVARLLTLGALFIVAIAETGRIPIDNPDTHLELTMAHEGMLLEYSGRPLGLLLWATHLKQLVVLSLLAALFLPWAIGREVTVVAVVVGLAAYLLKLGVLGFLLAAVETFNVKLRIFRAPELLGAASLMALLGVTSTFLVGG